MILPFSRLSIMFQSHALFITAAAVAAVTVASSPLLSQPQNLGDLRMITGKVLVNAHILAVEPDGLRLRHESGVSKIAYADLPASLRSQFPHDPVAAAEFAAKAEAAN